MFISYLKKYNKNKIIGITYSSSLTNIAAADKKIEIIKKISFFLSILTKK